MISALVIFVVYVVVLGLIIYLLNYLVDNVPIFQPHQQVAKTIIMVLGVLILILLLLGLLGVVDTGQPVILRR